MGLKVAVASGNWSSTSTWNGGVLPVAGDIVASNGFTVTIDQNVNVDSLTNAATAPSSSVPIMTGNTTPSGIVTVSAEDALYPGWQAFGSGVWKAPNNASPPAWVAYEFTTPTIITSYNINGGINSGAFPKDFTFEGWNGSSWVVLHTVVGNTNSSTYTGSFLNTTAYNKYRINVTAVFSQNYVSIDAFNLYKPADYLSTSIAGGTFILNSGVTVTCTNPTKGLSGQNTNLLNLLTYSGSGEATINANILYQNTTSARDILFNSSGTLNLVGNLKTNSAAYQTSIAKTGTGTLNIIGSLEMVGNYSSILTSSAGIVNITGDCTITSCVGNNAVFISLSQTTANISGNLYLYNCTNRSGIYLISNLNNSVLTITGTVTAQDPPIQTGLNNYVINNSAYCKIIGSIICLYYLNRGVISTSNTAINVFTGPFISGLNGLQPIYASRMNYIKTYGSYFEFRDSSTNGALPPAAAAPAVRLVSPDLAIDAPSANNVRKGVVYASGSQIGTMAVPSPGSVSYGVEVDNSIGTALLNAAEVWNRLTSELTLSGSIGERLKNTSTVSTTGNQIASF